MKVHIKNLQEAVDMIKILLNNNCKVKAENVNSPYNVSTPDYVVESNAEDSVSVNDLRKIILEMDRYNEQDGYSKGWLHAVKNFRKHLNEVTDNRYNF